VEDFSVNGDEYFYSEKAMKIVTRLITVSFSRKVLYCRFVSVVEPWPVPWHWLLAFSPRQM
jgi:hypothetical protein